MVSLFNGMTTFMDEDESSPGSGSSLPSTILILAGLSTGFSVAVSIVSVHSHLKNYLKPALQRMVIRIMVMVPIYGIASLISLFSINAAFFIDAIRDIYEAFVIYCFFTLLLSYLGGERSLLILLHGRPPKSPIFPMNLWRKEIDISDPNTFLFLKRGILQYVQIKPILAIVSLILKATGVYNEGDFRANSGYLYVSVIYNFSIGLSLYCLAVFWMCLNTDLKPYRPMPKFLCVKGILFFSFWQSIFVSLLVAAGLIRRLGPYTDPEHISIGLTDLLVCLEMPLFAVAHLYAFSYKDYVDRGRAYVARMPMYYAFRDSFGLLDVVCDSRATLRGEGMDYRDFEPSEGHMHQGEGLTRRIRAGLRYSKGGTKKYWLPQTDRTTAAPLGRFGSRINKIVKHVAGEAQGYDPEVYAPLLETDADAHPVRLAPDLSTQHGPEALEPWAELSERPEDLGYDLPFDDEEGHFDQDDALYQHSRKYLFGDYNYPCIDISSEAARDSMWREEERILRNERGWQPSRREHGQPKPVGYGAVGSQGRALINQSIETTAKGKGRSPNSDKEVDRYDRIIDHQQERMNSSGIQHDIRLKWTKISPKRPGSTHTVSGSSKDLHTRNHRTPAGSSSSGSPASGSKQIGISPPMTKRPVLPPDAIDLVVEDDLAAEQEHIYERQKGEPATHGGALRKVYRRGFVIEVSDGEEVEGEVEIGEHDQSEVNISNARPHGSLHQDTRDILEGESKALQELEGTIARAQTPPPHARVEVLKPPEDVNPWA